MQLKLFLCDTNICTDLKLDGNVGLACYGFGCWQVTCDSAVCGRQVVQHLGPKVALAFHHPE